VLFLKRKLLPEPDRSVTAVPPLVKQAGFKKSI
jgi:hypothetical protein